MLLFSSLQVSRHTSVLFIFMATVHIYDFLYVFFFNLYIINTFCTNSPRQIPSTVCENLLGIIQFLISDLSKFSRCKNIGIIYLI